MVGFSLNGGRGQKSAHSLKEMSTRTKFDYVSAFPYVKFGCGVENFNATGDDLFISSGFPGWGGWRGLPGRGDVKSLFIDVHV